MPSDAHVFFLLIGVMTVCLYVLYRIEMRSWVSEYFVGFPDVDVAEFNVALPLQDMLAAAPGLSGMGAANCAAADKTRLLELGGQYVQRTNNYRRDYPDTCSAPLTEFVGSVYQPVGGVGIGDVVPCVGLC